MFKKNPKIEKMNAGLKNGFVVDLVAYYVHRENSVLLTIPYKNNGEEKTVLIVEIKFNYKAIPKLIINRFAVHGNAYSSIGTGMSIDLAEPQKPKYFKHMQAYTQYLTQENMLEWWETKKFMLPAAWGEKNV